MKHRIRIIGGNLRGKQLEVPILQDLRPTPSRIRETLFNWLMHDIRGARCLDLFAGTGALGIEAYSRGASNVVFVEFNTQTYQSLTHTLNRISSEHLHAFFGNALDYLRSTQETFDIIFLDPPFKQNLIPSCMDLLHPKVSADGLVYVETGLEFRPCEDQWTAVKYKKAGQVYYGLYRKKS